MPHPGSEPLDDWLARRLGEDYPALRAPEFGPDAPAMLVRRRRILPLLDGVDELSADMRAAAFAELGRLVTSSDPMILTCRGQAWTAAGAAHAWVDATLTAQPLPASVAAGYVAKLSRGDPRWEPVLGVLASGTQSPACELELVHPLSRHACRALRPGRRGDHRRRAHGADSSRNGGTTGCRGNHRGADAVRPAARAAGRRRLRASHRPGLRPGRSWTGSVTRSRSDR
jgi:hypothetical protein